MARLKNIYHILKILAGSIKAKLLIAFSIFAVIVVFIALSFFWLEKQESKVSKISGTLAAINLKINEANSIQRDFFSLELLNPEFHETGVSEYLTRHWSILDSLKQDLTQIKNEKILVNTSLIDDITKLNVQINKFENLFDQLVTSSRKIGFESYGLEGELRRNIHAIEDAEYNIKLAKVLTLRRYEKDYFMRKEDKYIIKLLEALESLKADIKGNVLDETGRKKMLDYVAKYRNTFLEVVDINRKIGANEVGGIKRELSETAFAIEIGIKAVDDAIFSQTEKVRDRVKLLLLVLFMIFILLNMFLGYFVIQKLGRPINILSKAIHEAIQNNFKINKAIKSIKNKDEIGQISKDFVLLLNKVQERNAEILKQNKQLSTTQKNIKALQEIGNEITSMLAIEHIIEVAFTHINKLMTAPIVAIGIYNERKNSLEFLGKKESEEDFFKEKVSLENDTEFSVLCFENNQEIFIQNYEKEYKTYFSEVEEVPQNETKSLIYLPILSKNKKIGVMTVQNTETNAYDEYSLNILRNLAVYTAIAIDNASVYKEINVKNQKIVDSINYAQRIQGAMLPKVDYIKQHLANSFILFKPRDIVSGDFYWFAVVSKAATHETLKSGVISIQGAAPRNKNNTNTKVKKPGGAKGIFKRREKTNKIVLSAIDCTGHGIPGAFMSMIGKDILDTIIIQRGVTEPNIILNQLHNGVRNALRQNETNNRDGMDMSVCVIDKKQKTVDFAGAKNPLVYIQNEKLTVIKADKNPIGGWSPKGIEREFSKHTISFEKPTTFYMFSDGYPDQIGGEESRKFLTKKFRNLLLEIHKKPMEEQRFILNETLEKWMEGHKQVDDILVTGFQLG